MKRKKALSLTMALVLVATFALGIGFYMNPMTVNADDLVLIKTIQGNGYTAMTQTSGNNHYWSSSTGSDATLNSIIGEVVTSEDRSLRRNFGSTSQQYVTLFSNEYFYAGSKIKVHIYGDSCGHSPSYAYLYVNGTQMKYLYISSGETTGDTTYYYVVPSDGYYTFTALGCAVACTASGGHGIAIDSSYEVYADRQFLLTYNSNDSSGSTRASGMPSPNPDEYITYSTVTSHTFTVSNTVPKRKGYTFNGWKATVADSGGTTGRIFTGGDTIILDTG